MHNILRFLIACMLFTSFITHTIDISSSNLILSRMTISDVFGLISLVVFMVQMVKSKSYPKNIPSLFFFSLGAVFCFLLSIVTSLNQKATLFEILILLYLLFLSYVIYETFKNQLKFFLLLLLSTSFIMSFVGLFDLFAVNNSYPTIFNSAITGHAVSGFRYFAQAGNYSFTMLSILIPVRYYYYSIEGLSKNEIIFYDITIVMTLMFMIASGTISIMVSFAIAAIGFVIMNLSEKRQLKRILLILGFLLTFIVIVFFFAKDLYNNINYRIESRILNRDQDTLAASFIIDNFHDSILAFKDNYWFGSGLGGFVNNYSQYEIHGTYLKVMGETGLVGMIGYFVFLFLFIKFVIRLDRKYLQYLLPFLIANLISWSYNYHFRKKEFWVLFAFFMVFKYQTDKKVYES